MMNDNNISPGRYRSRNWLILLLLILIIGIYLAWSIGRPAYYAAKGRRLVETKNVAIGHLENEYAKGDGYAKAATAFESLIDELPEERLGRQNLAICRLLEFQSLDATTTPDARDQAAQTCRVAIDELLAEQQDADAYWLAAQFARGLNERTPAPKYEAEAIKGLKHATQIAPTNPAYWYALFEVQKVARDQQQRGQAAKSLKQAYALDPSNLRLLIEWLVVQAENRDPEIVQTLAQAERILEPIAASVQLHANVDVLEFVHNAADAHQSGNWDDVLQYARFILNVTKGEETTKADLRKLNPHPLEFVVQEFSDAFYDKYRPAKLKPGNSIDVAFRVQPKLSLAGLADVRDVVITDFDLDNHLDLLVLTAKELRVLKQNSTRDGWQLITQYSPKGMMKGILVADLDRDNHKGSQDSAAEEPDTVSVSATTPECFDSDEDVVLFGEDGIEVLRNELDPKTGTASLVLQDQDDTVQAIKAVAAAILVDFDHDSDLDLILSTGGGIRLLQNLGDGTFAFTDVSGFSILPEKTVPFSSLLAVDWDRDADIDLLLGSPEPGHGGVLENMRHGQFRFKRFENDFFDASSAQAVEVLECDGNQSWDLAAAGKNGLHLVQTSNPRPAVTKHLRSTTISADAFVGLMAWDYDNDAFADLLAWGDDRINLFRGEMNGDFQTTEFKVDAKGIVQACRSADLDNDGDLDLVVATATGITVFDNDGGNKNHWIQLRALGRSDNKGRANSNGIGSLAELKAGPQYQAQVIRGQRTHFGLGKHLQPDVVRIIWTNGMTQNIVNPQLDTVFCEHMFLKGSCPYVYTWDGERFSFHTDLLWAAPLGLQLAEGITAPSREWEYLRIPAEKLKAKDGLYRLQITEELWEAGYFDHVSLIAVDHPADIEIYSNEKVGPAEIAEFRVHTVRNPRLPVAARDQRGRDVLEKLTLQDGQFVRCFDKVLQQGLVEDHFLELDLGPWKSPPAITLFLTGWILPSDTSLNISFAQNPRVDGPRPPSVWVPDANGQWHESIAYMGFPGGKTKTIAVDLSSAFLTDDYRVRIKTTAEIYWDAAFITVDEPAGQYKLATLKLASAELRYRGFSERLPKPENSPQTYNYDVVSGAPRWPPMHGRFTRYGNVTELVERPDDRLVVMAAGDELTLAFALPEQDPPAGWKRDFLLHNVGWDKDADLNTVYGQDVEPLPFRSMGSYPPPLDAPHPNSEQYRQYLKTYQTREQNHAIFWKGLSSP